MPTTTTLTHPETGTPATVTIQAPPELSGAVLANFKNTVFLTREHSPKARGPVYVVRVIIGDLYRVRYSQDMQGYYTTEPDARRMFDKLVQWIVEDGDLWETLSQGPSDIFTYIDFDL